ncbi:hypothetical protein J6590_039308 [Homalodisca vitripennis]|nr:hypothetical protein J6590_039308 [Homalodisca vitripennis]
MNMSRVKGGDNEGGEWYKGCTGRCRRVVVQPKHELDTSAVIFASCILHALAASYINSASDLFPVF